MSRTRCQDTGLRTHNTYEDIIRLSFLLPGLDSGRLPESDTEVSEGFPSRGKILVPESLETKMSMPEVAAYFFRGRPGS